LQGETDGGAEIVRGRETVTGIETEIEEGEDMEVAVVLVAAAGVVHVVVVVAVVVVVVTGVAAEAVAGTGAETEQGVAVPETDEMIDQASWMINQCHLGNWCC
jgi:hypothetical protein